MFQNNSITSETDAFAPILILPGVFPPELCRTLIDIYDRQGGERSGFMVNENGRTVGRHDLRHKSRRDVMIEEQGLIGTIQQRIIDHVVPAIRRAHAFHVTRMERYLVACYDAEEG